MQLKIKRKDLQSSLQKIAGIANKDVIIEAGEKTKFSALSQNSSIEVLCDSEVGEGGKVCVEFQRLENIAKNYLGEFLTLKTTQTEWLSITGDNIKLKLPGVIHYEQVMFPTIKNRLEVDLNEFRRGVELSHHATIENAARACLSGIYIVSENGRLTFTGADSFSISRYYSKLNSDIKLLILKQTALDIHKLIDDSSVLYYDDSKIQLESDTVKLKSSLMQDHYPNVNVLIDKEKKNIVSVDRHGLNGIVNILTGIASVEKYPVVKFVFSKGSIRVESRRLNTGQGDGEIKCDYQGEEVSIGINLQVLKKTMTIINKTKDDNFYFHFDGSNSSIVLTTGSLQNYRAGLMPVRLGW
jgi:DNA polymerase III sliding clamp (beta) subunit (PCNA family)